jgi:hypothetical protein
MPKAPDPYAVTEHHGRPMLHIDKAAVMKMEHHLGYELTIPQAIGGAPDSKGAHLEGRMLDFAAWDGARKNRVAKDCGLISWERDERDGMVEHNHAGVIFISRDNRRGISSIGFNQIGQFDRGENGLVGNGRDRDPYRPSPKRLITLDEYRFIITGGLELPQPNAVTRMRDGMVETMHELTVSIHEGKTVMAERPAVAETVEYLRKTRAGIKSRLERTPKR